MILVKVANPTRLKSPCMKLAIVYRHQKDPQDYGLLNKSVCKTMVGICITVRIDYIRFVEMSSKIDKLLSKFDKISMLIP